MNDHRKRETMEEKREVHLLVQKEETKFNMSNMMTLTVFECLCLKAQNNTQIHEVIIIIWMQSLESPVTKLISKHQQFSSQTYLPNSLDFFLQLLLLLLLLNTFYLYLPADGKEPFPECSVFTWKERVKNFR